MPGSPGNGTCAQRKNRLSLRDLHQTLASGKFGRAVSPSRCQGPGTWGKTKGIDRNECSPGRVEVSSRPWLMSSYQENFGEAPFDGLRGFCLNELES